MAIATGWTVPVIRIAATGADGTVVIVVTIATTATATGDVSQRRGVRLNEER